MKDKSLTLTGWQAVPVFLMMVGTQVLTALAMLLPLTWLVNHVCTASLLHAIFVCSLQQGSSKDRGPFIGTVLL
ncbi:MAG: hypothetical protein ACP5E2_15900 [Terracidiphilus sp.]